MNYLLDTNVVSELRKNPARIDPVVAAWAGTVLLDDMYLSVLTIMELETGVLRAEAKHPEQGRVLRAWLEEQVKPDFSGRIIPVNESVALLAARAVVAEKAPVMDSMIGATAAIHGLTLVTRNVSDFRFRNLSVINPWASIQ